MEIHQDVVRQAPGIAIGSDRAIESEAEPHLYVDDQPTAALTKLANSNVWVHTAAVLQGRAHAHYYRINGAMHGERVDTSALTEDHYRGDDAAQGELSEHMVVRSEVYHGWPVSWWVYATPNVDPNVPSPVSTIHTGVGLGVPS